MTMGGRYDSAGWGAASVGTQRKDGETDRQGEGTSMGTPRVRTCARFKVLAEINSTRTKKLTDKVGETESQRM